MTDVFPFIGTRYHSRLIEDMNLVISPWYEMIPAEKQKEYRDRHPNNILHLIPSYENNENEEAEYENPFSRTASVIQAWRRDGILVNDNNKSFYLYEQTYAHPVAKCKVRRGVYALVNLSRQKPNHMIVEGSTPYLGRAFHLKILRATRCNFSPIPMFFHDSEGEFSKIFEDVQSSKPWEEIRETSGDTHRMWVINKKEPIAKMTEFFRNRKCFMVEGHKRFEVSLTYRDEQREVTGKLDGQQPFDYILVFLTSFEEQNVTTLPIHRVLSSEMGSGVDMNEFMEDLAVYFNITPIKVSMKKHDAAAVKILSVIADKGKKKPTIGMVLPDERVFALSLKNDVNVSDLYDDDSPLTDAVKNLDVSILNHYIIRQCWIGNPEIELEEEDLLYFEDAAAALKHSVENKSAATFLLNSCPMKSLTEVVAGGGEIPPFSVRLHPTIISGLIIRDMSVRH